MITNTNTINKNSQNKKKLRKKIIKKLYFLGGTISLTIGIIGIVLPILPTTVFLLIATSLYSKSSQKLYNWIINNKILGTYIRTYKEGKGIPLRVKIFTLSLLWLTILITMFLIIDIFWIQILLLIIAISVSIHIILIRPKIKQEK